MKGMTEASGEGETGEKNPYKGDNDWTESWTMSQCLLEGYGKDSLSGADVGADRESQKMKLLWQAGTRARRPSYILH